VCKLWHARLVYLGSQALKGMMDKGVVHGLPDHCEAMLDGTACKGFVQGRFFRGNVFACLLIRTYPRPGCERYLLALVRVSGDQKPTQNILV
jgi:hypothetical protein